MAKSVGRSVTALICDRLYDWIDPRTGEQRTRNGATVGPRRFRAYVKPTDTMYSEAAKSHSLVRLQVEVGTKVVNRIEHILGQNRISKGRILTALANDVWGRNLEHCPSFQTTDEEGSVAAESVATDEQACP